MVIRQLMPYPSTYVCESAFSAMATIKTKARNRLDVEADIRVALATTEADIPTLAARKQAQLSH